MPLGFFGVLFVALLILKLLGIVAWSWWIITMPLWLGPVALLICVLILTVLNRPVKRK